ncbi:MAG: protein jag [Chloroflexi bacterium]|nr:MAG: hypothetical protein CUN54_04545 [Phototrophicales bacterium]RMF82778.1 MAG: protein jag [Chloroflexota bacterium]
MDEKHSTEIVADTVEDAIAKGLAELGAGPGDVIVEVLEEPSKGMLGFGSRPARVRLQLLVSREAQPQETHEETHKTTTLDDTSYDDIADDYSHLAQDAGDEMLSHYQQQAIVDDSQLGDDANVGRAVLLELLDRMAIDADVTIRRAETSDDDDDTPWLLDVSGENLSRLIGRRGETLSALQYITRLITSRELQRRANIIIDVDGYKSRRAGKLHNLALRMAEQVTQRKQSVTLEPMPPYERRIIHLALRDYAGVDTRSVGEGDSRKVTIIPT